MGLDPIMTPKRVEKSDGGRFQVFASTAQLLRLILETTLKNEQDQRRIIAVIFSYPSLTATTVSSFPAL